MLKPQVCSGNSHLIHISSSGVASSYGENDFGQLGLNDTKNRKYIKQIELLKDVKIVKACCELHHTLLLSKDGNLYFFGRVYKDSVIHYDDNVTMYIYPIMIKFFSDKFVVNMWCTNQFFAQTNNGDLFAWGYNDSGQLGIGNKDNQLVPQKMIDGSSGGKIICIATGTWHTLFVIADPKKNHKVYGCGSNKQYQIGIGYDESDFTCPTPVSFFDGKKIVSVSTKCTYSLFLSEDSKVWVVGTEKHGALGLGSMQNVCEYPFKLPFFKNVKIVKIKAGVVRSIFISNTNQIWLCGFITCKTNYRVPTLLKTNGEFVDIVFVEERIIGLTKDGKVREHEEFEKKKLNQVKLCTF
jgi:alpha-tubulin suppressor-like RCC1 family protein